MLTRLKISNIILIENAEIDFRKGLNVLTGETGAGKSAIIQALNYIAGGRSDLAILRHAAEKGAVEAAFDIEPYPAVQAFIQEAGIEHDPAEELIIRRELSRQGKHRAFVNGQATTSSFLKKLGSHLIKMVGQHANTQLTAIEWHRELLDLYGGCLELRQEFEQAWKEECRLRKELEAMRQSEAERMRKLDAYQNELEELRSATLQPNEDELLFTEFTRLNHSEERAKTAFEIYQTLLGEDHSLITTLKRLEAPFTKLIQYDAALHTAFEAFHSALLELEEVGNTLDRYQASIEYDSLRIDTINERLKLINKLKKKYGPTLDAAIAYESDLQFKTSRLMHAESEMEEIEKKIRSIEPLAAQLASRLSQARQGAAAQLEQEMQLQLQSLHMGKALFFVELSPQKRTAYGDEQAEFYFAPNAGEKKISIRESASGGELSRIMLALQTLLAGKERTPILVFDEVDANIGGETALSVGQKLQKIGSGHQVLCITHFPQVARCATHHFRISKTEKNGRTFTEVAYLDSAGIQNELARMSGNGCGFQIAT